MRDASLQFKGVHALRNVSFAVRQGEMFSVIGPNGAGKTSLLNCISGRYTPSMGSLWFEQQDITRRRPSARAHLGIARTLMARPQLILLDEPSMGLSPILVSELFGIIGKINREQGIPMLLVEQNSRAALAVADYGYIMEGGKVVMEGSSAELQDNEDVKQFYLGIGESSVRRSFKDLKSYKRRKRWL